MLPSDLYDAQLLARNMWCKQNMAVDQAGGFNLAHTQELAKCAALLDGVALRIYDKWQMLGGTSDIKSVAMHKYYLIAEQEAAQYMCECKELIEDERFDEVPCSHCKEEYETDARADDVADYRLSEEAGIGL